MYPIVIQIFYCSGPKFQAEIFQREAAIVGRSVHQPLCERNPKASCESAIQLILFAFLQGLGFEYKCVTSADDFQEMLEHKERNYFICDDFKGEPFQTLYQRKCKVFGAPSIIEFCSRNMAIPSSSRPLYNGSMLGVIMCFTGFRKKEELSQMCSYVHHMGGSVRREYSGKVNYLVAHAVQGQKYKVRNISLNTCTSI